MIILIGPLHSSGAIRVMGATGVTRSDEGCFSVGTEWVDSWTPGPKPLCHRHPTGPHPSGLGWTPWTPSPIVPTEAQRSGGTFFRNRPVASRKKVPPLRLASLGFARGLPRACRDDGGGASVRSAGTGGYPAPAGTTALVGGLFRHVELAAAGFELVAHLLHALLGIVADVLRDPHGAELRPAHRAEVRRLVRVLGQGLVVELLRGRRIERQVELVDPAELEARLGERIVAQPRRGMALGEIGGVGGDLVGDHADLDVVAVGQAEMLLGRDVAEHRRAEPADHRGADARGDVVVARRDVGDERSQRVERRLAALA